MNDTDKAKIEASEAAEARGIEYLQAALKLFIEQSKKNNWSAAFRDDVGLTLNVANTYHAHLTHDWAAIGLDQDDMDGITHA